MEDEAQRDQQERAAQQVVVVPADGHARLEGEGAVELRLQPGVRRQQEQVDVVREHDGDPAADRRAEAHRARVRGLSAQVRVYGHGHGQGHGHGCGCG